MKDHLVWVETSFFAVEPGEEADTNPGIYGKTFSHWVAEKLRSRGESVRHIVPEDWGWCIVLESKPGLLWVGCSNRSESISEWGAFVCLEPSFLRLFSKRVATKVKQLESLLFKVMQEVPDAKRVWIGP